MLCVWLASSKFEYFLLCKEMKNLLDHILFKVNMSSIHKRNS